jgi:nucleoside-diphosphate-sugar epimerase
MTERSDDPILLTGCAGFIGSRVAAALLEAQRRVVGIDNLNDYYDVRLKRHRLEQLAHPRFRFVEGDIEDQAAVESLFAQSPFSCVINLAARAGVRSSMEHPHVYMTTNVLGSLNLLESMRRHGVTKYVLASTSSLYAGQAMPFVESLPVNTPISPYAASKKAAEVLAYTYHFLYQIDVSVVRYFTVYGPAGRPDMSVFRFIRWIDQQEPIELFGDGTQSRDFTYVDDIARGTVLAMRPVGYEIINLGGGNRPTPLLEVVEEIERSLGKKAQFAQRPFHQADMKATWADISKAKRLLDWAPTVTLREGIEKTVAWYRAQRPLSQQIRL